MTVVVDAKGRVVVNQDSLKPPDTQRRVIQHDERATGIGYGKSARPDKWTQKETDLFYDLLRQFGTDFTLMQFYFPNRNRGQIRAKFKREDKINSDKITLALKEGKLLDLDKIEELTGVKMVMQEPEEAEEEQQPQEEEDENAEATDQPELDYNENYNEDYEYKEGDADAPWGDEEAPQEEEGDGEEANEDEYDIGF